MDHEESTEPLGDLDEIIESAPGNLENVTEEGAESQGDLREAVESALGSLESLAKKIPGYKGYKEKELRREADKLLRNQLAGQLEGQRRRLVELQNRAISQAQIAYLDDLERTAMKLQLLTDRVKTASYGYAGLFDALKIKEEQLDMLYDFDARVLASVNIIAADIDRVESAVATREGVEEAISELAETLEQANRTFAHRHEAILQAADYQG
jgi:hypothetical protein